MGSDSPQTKGRSLRAWSRRIRWAVSATLIAAGFVAVLVTYLIPEARVCRQVAEQSGILVVCAPIGTQDSVLVGAYLLFATLPMWPDLAKLSISGFSFERVAESTRPPGKAKSDRPHRAAR